MSTQVSPPQRRKFLYVMLGGIGTLLGAASAWPVFRFLSPIDAGVGDTQVILARNDVPVGKAVITSYSIHYTKLYEGRSRPGRANRRNYRATSS